MSSTGSPHRVVIVGGGFGGLYAARAQAHGWQQGRDALRQLLGMDIELNAQGLEVWLGR